MGPTIFMLALNEICWWIVVLLSDVRYRGQRGKHLLATSISLFGPETDIGDLRDYWGRTEITF